MNMSIEHMKTFIIHHNAHSNDSHPLANISVHSGCPPGHLKRGTIGMNLHKECDLYGPCKSWLLLYFFIILHSNE